MNTILYGLKKLRGRKVILRRIARDYNLSTGDPVSIVTDFKIKKAVVSPTRVWRDVIGTGLKIGGYYDPQTLTVSIAFKDVDTVPVNSDIILIDTKSYNIIDVISDLEGWLVTCRGILNG